MKNFNLFQIIGVLLLSLPATALFAQGVKIGDNPAVQDPSAILELEKTNKGLLITRVSLADIWDVTTIPSPANSLLVYNTNFGGGTDPVSPGFYYWRADQARWIRLMTGSGGSGGDVWIDGNNNILSLNSADQTLASSNNIALGNGAFGDLSAPSNYVVAIGQGACNSETTFGDAFVVAIGLNTAYENSGKYLNAIGNETAYYNSGEHVNAMGLYACYGNTANSVNALGNAAASNNTGFEINALGPNSCAFNYGDVVNAMGWQSAEHNGGNDINAFGVRAAQNNHDTANSVNAIGLEAAQNNTGWGVNAMNEGAGRNNEGSLVNLLGPAAGENNDGWSVNLLGSQSGQWNTGSEVNAMGAMSAQFNTTGCINAFGLEAGRYNTGYGLNAMGFWAAKWNNGGNAVAIGDQALIGGEFVTEGEGNIGIGYHAGISVGTGFRNICIGWDTDITNPSANDQINIGNNIIREADGMVRLNDFIKLTPLPSPPSTTEEGAVYYDSSLQKLRVYTGSGWQDLN